MTRKLPAPPCSPSKGAPAPSATGPGLSSDIPAGRTPGRLESLPHRELTQHGGFAQEAGSTTLGGTSECGAGFPARRTDRPRSLSGTRFHYCPGCGHGIAHRLVAEIIDELDIRETTVGVASVGCSILIYNYLDLDMQEAAHGRAPAVATGIKRVLPDRIVFTYQGDGDLASIGLTEIVHAAARGENITVIFINNANYGMTGGQMAPTTLPGQKTTTTPMGRDVLRAGHPIRISELLATLEGPAYIARSAMYNPAEVFKTKKHIRKAFSAQRMGLGFSLVEILSPCPNNWGMEPVAALKWVEKQMTAYYPLGVFRDTVSRASHDDATRSGGDDPSLLE